MEYLDFDLEITRLADGRYRAAVRSPAGEASIEFVQPFAPYELENLILKMGLVRTTTRGSKNSPQLRNAETLGRRLFESVFQGAVRDCLTTSLSKLDESHSGLRIRLRLVDAPELNNWPWEYLYHPGLRQFVVLSTQTPLIRYLDLPRSVKSLTVTAPLRLLVMVSDPKDQRYARLDVTREKEKIAEAVRDLEVRGLLKVEWLEKATLGELQRRLRKPEPVHIFHFIGHGRWDEKDEEGLLIFTDEYGDARELSANNLATILGDHKSLRLVVMNSCEGARTSTTDPFAGSAATLVNLGLPAVLAMQFEISDRAAIQLAQVFYEALADGYPVEGALAEARKMLFADSNDVEWGTPVLYMRAKDGRLFDLQPTQSPNVKSQRSELNLLLNEDVAQYISETLATYKLKTLETGNPDRLILDSPFHLELIRIPAGEFLMGSDKEKDSAAYDIELPQHRVYLSEYYMARYPVTNLQYAAFKKIENSSGRRDHPVVNVSWTDAQAFCKWLSEKTGLYVRLPTEAEWEKAARGADGRIYPWGNEWDKTKCNSSESGIGTTTPVGQYSPQGESPYGLADMSGNVWEWCADWFGKTEYVFGLNTLIHDPQGPSSGQFRVLRGGAFDYAAWFARCASRSSLRINSDLGLVNSGFRVVCTTVPSMEKTPQIASVFSSMPTLKPSEPAIAAAPTPKPNPDHLTLTTPFHLELIRIPAGEFLMGSDKAKDKEADDNELPQHRVYVSEFYIGKYPVTYAQYQGFLGSTNYRRPEGWIGFGAPIGKEVHPIVNVSWDDAQAFCRWLSEESDKDLRLPTEAEWEKAARGTDGRIFPWGNEWEISNCNSYETGNGGTTPVAQYVLQGNGPYGIADASGNVWEWCADWYGEKEYQGRVNSIDDPQGPDSGALRVLRGGSWNVTRRYCRAAHRYRRDPSLFSDSMGFRVALSPSGLNF